jgi:1,4-alpha-glucan branching enzyme
MALENVIHDVSRFTEYDMYLFKEGTHLTLYDKMGSHIMEIEISTHGIRTLIF